MDIKKILAVALALVGGYFLLKALWWLLGLVFSVVFVLLQVVLVAVIAVPIYLLIRRKLLK
ncbi:MAG: hypothetical protein EHM43_06635 [Ignavibacteriae bacterium]|nr:MAG: hypothetical protein EHM43_06635 [Ignavibacteriota bacterium]